MLVENEKVVCKTEKIAYLFNTYFNGITKELNIERWQCSNLPCENPLVSAIRKYETHPTISDKNNGDLLYFHKKSTKKH